MPRKTLSRSELRDALGDDNDRIHQIRMRKKHGEYRVKRLYSNLAIPSYVHGYSLGIEFMRSWFLEKFPRDYFKTVYINGKHVLDDFKYFNRDAIKREKPMVAIVPTVEYDHDREYIDLYAADPDIFLKRSNYQQSFFKDDERDLYLGMNFQTIRMNFAYRVRVSSRAQQLDLFKRMELMFRIGATQKKSLSTDFHIPKDIILSIAEKAGFDIDKENKKVLNVMEFLSYMNSHSDLPILFKMRAINQKPEFFIRVRDMYTHIACRDKLSLDDGERDGQLDNNFHIDMAATLTMPIPHFFVFYSAEPMMGQTKVYEEDNNISVGLYSFNDFKIPEKNELGWYQIALTSYLCDKGEKFIDMSEVFSGNTNLDIVMEHNLKNFISPKGFIDIKVFRNDDRALSVKTEMDYETKRLIFLENMDEETVYIVIYADREYINETISSLEEYKKYRISNENPT